MCRTTKGPARGRPSAKYVGSVIIDARNNIHHLARGEVHQHRIFADSNPLEAIIRLPQVIVVVIVDEVIGADED